MQIEQTEILPVYALVGADRFTRTERLEEILQCLSPDMDTLCPARFDGTRAELADVLDELRTPSLLGARRVVVVDDADDFVSAHRVVLERYVLDPAPGGTLILLCNTLPRTTRLYRAVQNSGKVITCPAPSRGALADWLSTRARDRYGKAIHRGAAQRLREHVGDSLAALDAELAKLAAYADERPEISIADIDALTGHHREEKIFRVTDAMAAGDVAAALAHWDQVLATDRAAPVRAIAGLAWGVRRLLNARREWRGGTQIFTLAKQMYMDPEVLRRRLSAVSAEQLESQLRDLLAADVAVKTGNSTAETAVTNFIVKHGAGQHKDEHTATGGRRR